MLFKFLCLEINSEKIRAYSPIYPSVLKINTLEILTKILFFSFNIYDWSLDYWCTSTNFHVSIRMLDLLSFTIYYIDNTEIIHKNLCLINNNLRQTFSTLSCLVVWTHQSLTLFHRIKLNKQSSNGIIWQIPTHTFYLKFICPLHTIAQHFPQL